ncbi:Peptidase_M19-domain-containing protein [Sphaerulina musiva SO2202]|uniref:Dipeptidase n=1 Tax=Sphaerulina musiva (strain SO2202) TaxID=692275 RepID=M3CZI7_SPHMS|nr:Peptidase_M19-domain-containing protein [Sphaerulina musiva SO2202]EMF10049.1 Peptidase_M19-domain-containing protein [Sphaerulina musiva SO2202]
MYMSPFGLSRTINTNEQHQHQRPVTMTGPEKRPPLPRPSPQLLRVVEGSRSNTKTLLQLILILTLVISGYCTFDPDNLRRYLPEATSTTPSELTGVKKILAENPLIDGHNDLLILLRSVYGNKINTSNFTTLFTEGTLAGHIDIPRATAGQLGGAFWSAFVPCPANGSDFSDAAYAPYVKATLEQIDLFNRISQKFPKYFTLPSNAAEAEANFAAGKLISPLAIEGLHQIGNSLATLRLYHKLGARYATLTWNCHNRYADAAVVSINGVSQRSTPFWGGVSPAGQTLIKEMNRLGMIVDLSHVSPDTMRDVLGGSSNSSTNTNSTAWTGSLAPPIFSHSSVYSICPHPRNVPDSILDLVRLRNSLVMINISPDFISCEENPSSPTGLPTYIDSTNTIEQVVKHIMYVGDRIGYDHVGLGTDFDGIENTPRGMEDVSKFPDLIEMLLEKGVSEKDVIKVAGGNLLRVWREVDRVAEKLQGEMEPAEDDVGGEI